MSKPTEMVRLLTYARDEYRCVSCGSLGPLQYQHRAAEGMGGRKARPKLEEGLTSCWDCNPRYETDLQADALRFGWKVRRFVVDRELAALVPVFVPWEGWWFRLEGAARIPIFRVQAVEMMREVYGDAYDEEQGLVG